MPGEVGPGGGGGGGGGLHFRRPADTFNGATIAAARTARDTYFATTAGVAALPAFQGDQSLAIILTVTGQTARTFETYLPGQTGMAYDNTQWVERTDAIQGDMGVIGAQARFTVSVYNNAVAAPATPTGGSYVVETGVLTAPAGWTIFPTPPAAGENIYESQFVVNPLVDSGTLAPTWSEPVESPEENAEQGALAAQAAAEAARNAAGVARDGAVAAQTLAQDARDEAGSARNAAQSSQIQAGQSAAAASASASAAATARAGAEAARDAAQAQTGFTAALTEAVTGNTETGIDVTVDDNGKLNFEVTGGGGTPPVTAHARYVALTLAVPVAAADFLDDDYGGSSDTEDITIPVFTENRYLTFTRRADLAAPTFIGVKNGQNQIGGFIELAATHNVILGGVEQALWEHVDPDGEAERVYPVLSGEIWTIR